MRAETARRLEAIRELAAQDLSAGQIAERLGLTRGAVMGIVHRSGVKLANARVTPPTSPHFTGPAKPAQAADNADPLPRRALQKQQRDGCRWPLWGDREPPTHEYCGGAIATPGRPYCAEHEARSRSSGPRRRGCATRAPGAPAQPWTGLSTGTRHER